MPTMRLKKQDGTWDKVPVLGSYQAVLAANEAATNAQNAANYAEVQAESVKKYKALWFDSVAAMKAEPSLTAGAYVCTAGYYTPNDGGGTSYLIRAKTDSDVDDGGSLHQLLNGLVAELIIENGTVYPEQFGAKGDGVSDDINFIQSAIDYSLKNKQSVKFTKDYIISRSLMVSSDSEFSNYGVFINGNNKKLIISNNDSAIIVIGSDNTIKDLTVTYTNNLYTKYSSSFIQLRATPETFHSLSRNIFDHITVRCSEEWREHILYNSIAFEIVLYGTNDARASAYDNKFVSCICRNIGTCIKITENEYSSGCNGNEFDVSGWALDCYLNGRTGRCVFKGLVQPEELKTDDSGNIVNKYIFKNMGDYNLINCSIYDYNDSKETINRPLVVDKSGLANYFTQTITPEGVEKNILNFYNFYSDTCGNIILPFSPFVSNFRVPMLSYIPFHNSFNMIEEATMKIENVSISNGYPQTNDKYTEISDGVYTNVAAIFHDDSNNRQLGFFKYTGSGEGLLTIEFVPKGIIDVMFIYFKHYSGVPSGVHLKLEYSNGTEIIYDMEQSLGNGGSIAHYINYNGNRVDIPTKAQIIVDINKNRDMCIGQICGYMHNDLVGIV